MYIIEKANRDFAVMLKRESRIKKILYTHFGRRIFDWGYSYGYCAGLEKQFKKEASEKNQQEHEINN